MIKKGLTLTSPNFSRPKTAQSAFRVTHSSRISSKKLIDKGKIKENANNHRRYKESGNTKESELEVVDKDFS
jgi:hypothetical protein